jgi:hypothetical protein
MSDDTQSPQSASPQSEDLPEDDGVLDFDDTLETDDLSADPLDTGISPPERNPASERYGVTLAESRTAEPLDQRLAEEEPDFGGPGSPDGRPELEQDEPPLRDGERDPRAGRLVSEDEGAHRVSDRDYVGRDVGIDGGASSAEEAAMHVVGDGEYEYGEDDAEQ